MKFKKGDKIECIKKGVNLRKGGIFTVTGYDEPLDDEPLVICKEFEENTSWFENRFILHEKKEPLTFSRAFGWLLS